MTSDWSITKLKRYKSNYTILYVQNLHRVSLIHFTNDAWIYTALHLEKTLKATAIKQRKKCAFYPWVFFKFSNWKTFATRYSLFCDTKSQ